MRLNEAEFGDCFGVNVWKRRSKTIGQIQPHVERSLLITHGYKSSPYPLQEVWEG